MLAETNYRHDPHQQATLPKMPVCLPALPHEVHLIDSDVIIFQVYNINISKVNKTFENRERSSENIRAD